ncbi:hypothetical protein KKG22_05070, partial [Patescibacteria group bacterium]|nr:hypothetical protein [Patescibacteria group bacterium]
MEKQGLAVILCAFFLAGVLISSTTLAATSTIIVTSTPFLSFTYMPDSISIGILTVPITNTALTSDTDGNLPSARHLTISDTRGCGGL